MTQQQRREYFRLQYPLQGRPSLTINGRAYPVVEISEEGGRVAIGQALDTTYFDPHPAIVCFRSGKQLSTVVTYYRTVDEEMVLRFAPPIPQSTILAEQQWISSHFPSRHL